jgi:hypothetical protein
MVTVGDSLDLSGYRQVFFDPCKTFSPYDPVSNPDGHWATAGVRAFDGTLGARTLAEIDADEDLCVRHRCPGWAGEIAMFTDATMGPEFATTTARGGNLRLVARPIPDALRARAFGREYMAPRIWLTDHGAPRTFRYGYFEATMTINTGNSSHAAFWLMSVGGWTLEIDIMEYLGHWSIKGPDRDQYHTSIHLEWNAQKFGEMIVGHPINGQQRRFGLLWTKDEISFFLDRKAVRTLPNPGAHEPLYPIINLAIGSPWALQRYRGGGGPPNPADFPMGLIVNHVIISQ